MAGFADPLGYFVNYEKLGLAITTAHYADVPLIVQLMTAAGPAGLLVQASSGLSCLRSAGHQSSPT